MSGLDGPGQPAPQGCGGEHEQPDQVQVLGAELVAEPTGQQQRHGVGQQIGTGDPDDRVVIGLQLLHDAGVRDRDDGRVDQDHEETDHHGPQRIPGPGHRRRGTPLLRHRLFLRRTAGGRCLPRCRRVRRRALGWGPASRGPGWSGACRRGRPWRGPPSFRRTHIATSFRLTSTMPRFTGASARRISTDYSIRLQPTWHDPLQWGRQYGQPILATTMPTCSFDQIQHSYRSPAGVGHRIAPTVRCSAASLKFRP